MDRFSTYNSMHPPNSNINKQKRQRNEPIEKTIKDWFNRNRSVHNLEDLDIEELTDYLTNKYKEKYGYEN